MMQETALKNRTIGKTVTSLAIFDFDSTLFRSPQPSWDLFTAHLRGQLCGDLAWFQEPELMAEPLLPLIPSRNWWHEATVLDAAAALKDPSCLTIMLTGRRLSLFGPRIQKLCMDCIITPLMFDAYFARPDEIFASTLEFKCHVIDMILHLFHSIEHVCVWEDRERHVKHFEKHLSHKNIRSSTVYHVVHDDSQVTICPKRELEIVRRLVSKYNDAVIHQIEALCTPQSGKGNSRHAPYGLKTKQPKLLDFFQSPYYTGIFLDPESKAALMSRCPPPPGWSIRADHVTVNLGPAQPRFIERLGALGTQLKLKVTAIGDIYGKVQAVSVDFDDGSDAPFTANTVPHVTLYLAIHQGAKAKESNEILNWSPIEPFTISGTFKEKFIWGVRGIQAQDENTPKAISIGELILKHHPYLIGRRIGEAIQKVTSWMANQGVKNDPKNASRVENFIASKKAFDGDQEDIIVQEDSPTLSTRPSTSGSTTNSSGSCP